MSHVGVLLASSYVVHPFEYGAATLVAQGHPIVTRETVLRIRHCAVLRRPARGVVAPGRASRRDRGAALAPFLCHPAAHAQGPEVATKIGGEKAVDDRVGDAVERSQALDECGHRDGGLRLRSVAVHLQQVVDEVRTPTEHEHKHNDERHFYGLNLRLRNDAPGARPFRVGIVVACFAVGDASLRRQRLVGGELRVGKNLALGPDGVHDDAVARSDDECGNEEQGSSHQGHVHLPLPMAHVDPAL